ncbi:MAG TPA: DUF371 domain-containing protein [Jatrophihabitans sp.]|nr:DUF371 domain-containing protein [Jatrophihabitans sp.]
MSELVTRFGARGHPQLRASHAKTLEFTTAREVTGRATCVLGVAATLPAEPAAGPLRLLIAITSPGAESPAAESPAADAIEFTVDAVGNPHWQLGSSAVLRRSEHRLPDTFATSASAAASDLPREVAAALTDPGAMIEVSVLRRPSAQTLVRLLAGGTGADRLRVEAAAANLIVAEDAGARAVLTAAGIASGGEPGGRTLTVTSRTRPHGNARADEVIGWPAELAVLAATGHAGEAVLTAGADEVARLAARNPAAAVVFRAEPAAAAKAALAANRPAGVVAWVRPDDAERPRFGTGAVPHLPERGEVVMQLGPEPAAAAAAAVDPAALVRGLLGQGVSPRTAALALAGVPGWSRRSAYEFVLSVSG